jgi:hypothetical protein
MARITDIEDLETVKHMPYVDLFKAGLGAFSHDVAIEYEADSKEKHNIVIPFSQFISGDVNKTAEFARSKLPEGIEGFYDNKYLVQVSPMDIMVNKLLIYKGYYLSPRRFKSRSVDMHCPYRFVVGNILPDEVSIAELLVRDMLYSEYDEKCVYVRDVCTGSIHYYELATGTIQRLITKCKVLFEEG